MAGHSGHSGHSGQIKVCFFLGSSCGSGFEVETSGLLSKRLCLQVCQLLKSTSGYDYEYEYRSYYGKKAKPRDDIGPIKKDGVNLHLFWVEKYHLSESPSGQI